MKERWRSQPIQCVCVCVCVCVLAIEMSHEDFNQGKDMIQFMFLKGKSSPIQTFKSRQKKVPPLYEYSYK